VDGLVCRSCKVTYPMNDPRWRCDCTGLLEVRFRPRFDKEKILRRKHTMWRYREALPVDDDAHVVSFDEGMTPMIPADIGPGTLLLKLEQLFPTGSYKDRGAAVLISKAKEMGVTRVVEDSSGNAGCAIAAYAARAGIECEILVPESTSPGKLAQILLYGAALRRIPGSREDTASAAYAEAERTYYASHAWNPFFFQGTKTFAYEVWEQLGFCTPDALLLPAGNGTLVIGSFIGFRELLENGLIDKLPRLIAVQAQNCAPLLAMFREGLDAVPVIETRETIAEGVAIAAPVRGKEIVDIVRETGGEVLAVSDEEVERALLLLGRDLRPAGGGFPEVPECPIRFRRRPAHGPRPQSDREDAKGCVEATGSHRIGGAKRNGEQARACPPFLVRKRLPGSTTRDGRCLSIRTRYLRPDPLRRDIREIPGWHCLRQVLHFFLRFPLREGRRSREASTPRNIGTGSGWTPPRIRDSADRLFPTRSRPRNRSLPPGSTCSC